MKRKTPDTPKIPSGKAPQKEANAKGILAFAPASTPLTPFEELIEEWISYCRSSGLAPKTLIDYREFVSKFYWWWTEHARKSGDNVSGSSGSGRAPHPADVTTRDVRDFAACLRTPLAFRWGTPVPPRLQTLSPTTVSTYGRHIKVFFNWLEQEEYIERSPINRGVKFSNKNKQDKVIKLVDQGELGKLFRFLNQPERLKSFTGARDLAVISLLLDKCKNRFARG